MINQKCSACYYCRFDKKTKKYHCKFYPIKENGFPVIDNPETSACKEFKNINSKMRICSNCKYYKNLHKNNKGKCTRYAPIAGKSNWPKVNDSDSCGEFKQRDQDQYISDLRIELKILQREMKKYSQKGDECNKKAAFKLLCKSAEEIRDRHIISECGEYQK